MLSVVAKQFMLQTFLSQSAQQNSSFYQDSARKSNQSILKEIDPGESLEELMLKLSYFGHLMQRADSVEKTLMLGKIEGRRRREQ